jgi:TPR repeat protein
MLGGIWLSDGRAPEAVDLFQRAARAGNADGRYNLGVCHRLGLGVPVDIAQAERWYRAAAEAGNAPAQLVLGDLLLETARSEGTRTEAVKWYRAAADNGHAHALLSLGRVHELGLGVPQDLNAALAFYTEAAKRGVDGAASHVARLDGRRFAAV